MKTMLQNSQLLKYEDLVNDLDVFSALRFTIKGPQSLGNRSSHNINVRLRGVHVSYIGSLDLNVYSSSSPGLSGLIVPMAKTDGLYFDKNPEPQNQEFEISEAVAEQSRQKGNLVVTIGEHDPLKYYDAKYKMMQEYQKFSVSHNWNDGALHITVKRDDYSEFI